MLGCGIIGGGRSGSSQRGVEEQKRKEEKGMEGWWLCGHSERVEGGVVRKVLRWCWLFVGKMYRLALALNSETGGL